MTTARATKGDKLMVYIERYIEVRGYSPTVREMVDGCDLSSTSVCAYWLRKLRDSGLITWVDGQSRTVRQHLGWDGNDIVVRLMGAEARMFREAVPDGDDPTSTAHDLLLAVATETRKRFGHRVNGH